jgi:hypothetical protein
MASSDTPALTSLKMGDSTIGLLMAWKGIRDHQALFYSRNSGQGWTPQEEIRGSGSSHRPALADVGSERAFMAWKGIRDHQAIFWSTFDGRAWAPQQEIAGIGTSDSPALVGYKDRLHMFWKGVAGDGAL